MTLYRTKPLENPPLFIDTQRLIKLVVGPNKTKWECLQPDRFREFRRKGNVDQELGPALPKGCSWEVVPGPGPREEYLANLSIRRLCLVVDAGVGKTTALQQTQYLRSRKPGHLALGVRFADLPTNHRHFLSHLQRDHWLVDQLLASPSFADKSPAWVLSLLERCCDAGRFSLIVDALDQQVNSTDAPKQVEALVKFLELHPEVRCVIAGRPYVITDFFKKLDGESWEFAQVATFAKAERELYLGKYMLQAIGRLEADLVSVPRMLAAVRELSLEELAEVRTAAGLYDRLMDHALDKAYEDQPDSRNTDIEVARRVFALLAWGLWKDQNTDGIPYTGFSQFVKSLWDAHSKEIADLAESKAELEQLIEKHCAINEIIDFAFLEQGKRRQLYFRDRTLQDFFAALWITRYGREPSDLAVVKTRITVGYYNSQRNWEQVTSQNVADYDFWKFVCGMPVAGRPSDEVTQTGHVLALLFEAPQQDAQGVWSRRPCELMWRAWPQLVQCAGARLPRDWAEADLDRATEELLALPPAGTPALKSLRAFRAEFPALCEQIGSVGEIARGLRFDPYQADQPEWPIQTSSDCRYRLCPPWGTPHTYVMGSSDGNYQPAGAHAPWPEEAGRSRDETPDIVTVGPFWLRDFAVTNAELELFLACHGSERKGESKAPSQPAVNVSWYESVMFCRWLGSGYRLPTEREWEAACRGRREREFDPSSPQPPYSCGKTISAKDANFAGRLRNTTPRGTYPPNAWGLYDLHGNVWEWCVDAYRENAHDANENASTLRVLRGGCWYVDVHDLRSALRIRNIPGYRVNFAGLRLART